ncbi:MAG: pyridoxamine 5'-phosphate oxidase family protein [Candidatus Helarchaeota archaeon]
MMEKKALFAFQEDAAPKFLASLSKEGIPNIVPILSLDALNENMIFFGDYMIWKTKKNLLENSKVACAVTSMNGFKTYIVKGDFQEFIRTGELVNRANHSALFRFNAYTGVRGVGKISVKKTYPPTSLLTFSMIINILKMKIGKGKVEKYKTEDKKEAPIIPHRIMEKFKGITSFKFLAYKDSDDYPMIIPITSLSPKKDRKRLVFSFSGFKKEIDQIPVLSKVAISILKMETDKNILSLAMSKDIPFGEIQPIAYQVKGVYMGVNKFRGVNLGVIDVDEVYSASPPLPGERLA